MTPREIVTELDQHIIGQHDAKRSVALALRNRYRRMNVDESMRDEVTPKNILMIGPTGVGKTEIARRLATLAQAPFVKVEATKFTEVGYVGKEVDSIIRELADAAVQIARDQAIKKQRPKAEREALERVLDTMLPGSDADGFGNNTEKWIIPKLKLMCLQCKLVWKLWLLRVWKKCHNNCNPCFPVWVGKRPKNVKSKSKTPLSYSPKAKRQN